VEAFESYRITDIQTDRQADRQTRLKLYTRRFADGQSKISGASIPPEAMVHSPQDGRMGPPNFWL